MTVPVPVYSTPTTPKVVRRASLTTPKTPSSSTKFASLVNDRDSKIQELVAENILLEKEVSNYRKEMAQDVKRFEDQMRSLVNDNDRLKDLNHSLEDKLALHVKEKMELSISLQNLKNQLKETTSERDKIERELTKELQRLENANSILTEKNRSLTKDKIDFQNQVAVLTAKLKDSEQLTAKYEREMLKEQTAKSETSVNATSLKIKENEIRRLSRANQLLTSNKEALEKTVDLFTTKESALKQTVSDLETRMEELEQENTVLSMKVNRLEASHDYACQLEEELETMTSKMQELKH